MIEDTSKRDPNLHLLGGWGGDSTEYVTGMESAGQRQLVESTDLPTKGSDDPKFLALGFTFGDPHKHDPLFRPATLPAGWRKQAKDHAMGSSVVDELGRERVSVFYKAAYYDRRADMHLTTVYGYVMHLEYEKGAPILDDAWATAEAVTASARGLVADAKKSLDLYQDRADDYARRQVVEKKKTIAWAEALIARLGA